jgi:asparagine synthase (glutamine-hydrolysing)
VGRAIDESVQAHLVADVPVGVFLSAGLDSSLVAALVRRHLAEPPVTVTVRFERFQGTPLDEGPLAAETAHRLGTRHVERVITDEELQALWHRALGAMDQPSIDGFNTYLVSLAAREAGLKVVLSGLGGDELFGSYPSFADVPRWRRAARALQRLPGLRRAWPALSRGLRPGRPKLAGLLAHGASLAGAYYLRRGLFLPEELPALLGRERAAEGLRGHDPIGHAAALVDGTQEGWSAVQRLESGLYLRNQLLRDSDWASMAHSLELRVPFVDAHLRAHVAAAGFEPARSQGKRALVRSLAPELPAAILDRPKSGFAVPSPEPSRRPHEASRRLALRLLRWLEGAPDAAGLEF